jgi:cholesterol transport system auxiliary component
MVRLGDKPRGRRVGRKRLALVALVSLALAGCTTLISGPPNAIFDLSAPRGAATARGSLQILVPQPTAVAALDTDRIAARPSPSEYAYIGGSVWSDSLPKLVQARLVQYLQNSGRVKAAAIPGQGLLIDYQLVVDIRAFELTPAGAVADFAVRLMDDRNGRVIRSRVFRAEVPVASADARAVVPALDQAMNLIFAQIGPWAFNG